MLYPAPNYQCINISSMSQGNMSQGKKIVEKQNSKDARLWSNVKQSSMKFVINLQLSRLV